MKYYVIEPEVAGGFGVNTLIDRSTGKSEVKRLHYELEGWLGDELLESTPCFIASERLGQEIAHKKLSGVRFAEVEITTSDAFRELNLNKPLPKFIWLKIGSRPAEDDFGITLGLNLVVSEAAFQLLKSAGISNAASVREYVMR